MDDRCPYCDADLSYGPGSRFSRQVGVEMPGVYDGVLVWECPNCQGRWHAHSPQSPYRKRAEPYIRPSQKVEPDETAGTPWAKRRGSRPRLGRRSSVSHAGA